MRTALIGAALAITFALPAQAGILEWLQAHRPQSTQASATKKPHAQTPSLPAPELVTLAEGRTEAFPALSPDGRHLLVVSAKGRKAALALYTTSSGEFLRVLEDDPDAVHAFGWLDDAHIFFFSHRAGAPGIWKKSANGTGPLARLVRLDAGARAAWPLADGAWLVLVDGEVASKPFAFARAKRQGTLVRLDADGTAKVLAQGGTPSVSPNGQWIAFSMAEGKSRHIFVIRADGTGLVQLTTGRFVDAEPALSPDGEWIVFTSNRPITPKARKRHWHIWAIRRDGTGLQPLTSGDADDGAPRVGTDGKVYFHSNRKVSKELAKQWGVRRAVRGFHIWRVPLPKKSPIQPGTQGN